MSIQKDIFIFLGPPGSGKGTLAQRCVEELSWLQLSTGNLCRNHIARQTEIGKEIDFGIKSGKLVSDDLISRMVNEWIGLQVENNKPIIFDGYPRTVAQARMFSDFLREHYPFVSLHVVRFLIPDEVVVRRLASRYVCENKSCQAVYSLALHDSSLAPKNDMICDRCEGKIARRSDDEEATIRERLVVYHKHESSLLDFFIHCGEKIVEIDADKSLDHVFQDFAKEFKLKLS